MANELNLALIFEKIPVRKTQSNKGNFGKALIVAGSSTFRGAAALAVEGALRTGAGLVTLAAIEPVIWGITPRLPECCYLPCVANANGGISKKETDNILAKATESTAVLLGCGLGNTEETYEIVEKVTANAHCPVVLDADALNVLANCETLPHPQDGHPLILTPHPGEMARLSGLSIDEIQNNRAGIAANFARANDCYVVLKGNQTVIASPEGITYQNPTGNAGLARGGSGDILAGMIVSFLAQGICAVDAASCAVYLHGAAADETAKRSGQYAMLPHDIFYDLSRLFAQNDR